MKNYGLLFAGQGAQYIGMGKDLYEEYDFVKELYAKANAILGYKLEDIIFKENSLLNQTKYTQTAILVTSIAMYEVLKRKLSINPVVMSGFSLGEYTALYASGVFSFEDVIKLVNLRANFMDEAANANQGSMAAILNPDFDILNKVCAEVGNVWIANYNSYSQVVISGLTSSVDIVLEKLSGLKIKAIKLNVSGAFHCPLMYTAAKNFEKVLKDFTPNQPNVDIIMNYNAKPLEFSNLFEAMTKQIYMPVQFIQTIEKMISDYKVDNFIEIGPGKTLSGFVKRINREVETLNFENLNLKE